MSVGAVVRRRTRYGLEEWIKTNLGFYLRFAMTFFLCLGIIIVGRNYNFDPNIFKLNNQPPVSVTASPGYISLSAEILDNSNTVQVVSHSTVPVDAVVKAKDERDLFTYFRLMPGKSFYFEYEEPCTVIAAAS